MRNIFHKETIKHIFKQFDWNTRLFLAVLLLLYFGFFYGIYRLGMFFVLKLGISAVVFPFWSFVLGFAIITLLVMSTHKFRKIVFIPKGLPEHKRRSLERQLS